MTERRVPETRRQSGEYVPSQALSEAAIYHCWLFTTQPQIPIRKPSPSKCPSELMISATEDAPTGPAHKDAEMKRPSRTPNLPSLQSALRTGSLLLSGMA